MANGKRNYEEWSKEELIREVLALKKQKTYGLVWEREKTKEEFDLFINWEGEKTKEEFGAESKDKFPVLAEVKDKEISTDKEKPVNLLIEGDNYHSLAVLNFTHKGAVDVIYIDPPYNTGNKDFKYNDRYVDKEDGYRHSKWISFMSKRLSLAKNLLKETGLIFISIDENEHAQLKLLTDDVFGENNYILEFVWKKRKGGGSDSFFAALDHEYILCYAKNKSLIKNPWMIEYTEEYLTRYSEKDDKGRYYWDTLSRKGLKNPILYDVKSPDGETIKLYSQVSEKTFYEKIKTGEIRFKKTNGGWSVQRKVYLPEGKSPRSIIDDIATNADGKDELRQIFSGKDIFSNPKPVDLIKHLISLNQNKDSIILDFFAGSGTTGHAVLKINVEDGGKRSFILCTNNEDNNGDHLKVCTDICYPRTHKVIMGYNNLNKDKIEGLGGNLKYFKTDFVEAAPTDKNKRKLVDKCTEMLCIKENAFDKVKEAKKFRIFKNKDGYLGIIFDDEYIADFIKEAEKIIGKFNVYVFSHDDSVPTKEFKAIKNRVTLCPIPETILKVYRKVFKND